MEEVAMRIEGCLDGPYTVYWRSVCGSYDEQEVSCDDSGADLTIGHGTVESEAGLG